MKTTTNGPVAQLGEHLVCNQGVRGSNPLRSTSYAKPLALQIRVDLLMELMDGY